MHFTRRLINDETAPVVDWIVYFTRNVYEMYNIIDYIHSYISSSGGKPRTNGRRVIVFHDIKQQRNSARTYQPFYV